MSWRTWVEGVAIVLRISCCGFDVLGSECCVLVSIAMLVNFGFE